MSLHCPTSSITYNTSAEQKLHSKNAAKLYRFGSPKLRDLLREKCRVRVREARRCNFEKSRLHGNFNLILRQELAVLEQDIDLQEEIYKELLEGMNEWFVEQMQQEEMYLIDAAENDTPLCPLCQKLNLQHLEERVEGALVYNCGCGAKFHYSAATEDLRSALRVKIDQHEQQCVQCLTFFLEPQASRDCNVLNAFCEKCDYYCSL